MRGRSRAAAEGPARPRPPSLHLSPLEARQIAAVRFFSGTPGAPVTAPSSRPRFARTERSSPARTQRPPPRGRPAPPPGTAPPGTARSAAARAGPRLASASSEGRLVAACGVPRCPRRRRPLWAPSGRGAFPSKSRRAPQAAAARGPSRPGWSRAPREGGSPGPSAGRRSAAAPAPASAPASARGHRVAAPANGRRVGARGRGLRRGAAPDAGGAARSLAYPCGGRGAPGGSRGCSPHVG